MIYFKCLYHDVKMGHEDKWRKVQDPVTKHGNHHAGLFQSRTRYRGRVPAQCRSKWITRRKKTSLTGIRSVWESKNLYMEQAGYKRATQSPVVQRPYTSNRHLRLHWTLKADDIRRLEAFEMRCLRCILGLSLKERRRNDSIRKSLHITITMHRGYKQEETEVVWPCNHKGHLIITWHCRSARISQTPDHVANGLRSGQSRSAKTQGYKLPQQNAEHPTERGGDGPAGRGERGSGEDKAAKSSQVITTIF